MAVITRLPLTQLTTSNGDAKRVGEIDSASIRDLLRTGVIRFVVADVGMPLDWVPASECFDFWKREVQPHLVEPEQPCFLDQFPGEYAYFASQWEDGSGPIVLLAKIH